MPEKMSDAVMENEEAADCLMPMGITSENVAKQYKVSREVQDKFAAESQNRAHAAQQAGKFKSEIVVVKYTDDDGNERTVDADDGIRAGVTAEALAKLKPAFAKDGTTHAGNASQVSDGAAAVLLARRSVAKKLGLPILGKFVTAAVVGVPPNVMGIGPAFAIPRVLELTGLSKEDIEIYEINEAFASQAVMSVQHLKLPGDRVNPVGGAIALGHPLGCTGARQIATGLAEAKRESKKLIVTSMCIGTGMGEFSSHSLDHLALESKIDFDSNPSSRYGLCDRQRAVIGESFCSFLLLLDFIVAFWALSLSTSKVLTRIVFCSMF